MKDKLHVEETSDKKSWDEFIKSSENRNFFSLSDYISRKNFNYKKFFIKKSEEILASFHLFFDNNNIIKNDIVFTSINYKLLSNNKAANYKYNKFYITECFAEFIYNNYNKGEFILDYYTDDLRPFTWLNFNKNKVIFNIKDIFYTSIVDLKKYNNGTNEENFVSNLSRSIKQQYKLSVNSNFIFKENFDLDFLKKVTHETFLRQNISLNKNMDEYFYIIEKIYKKNMIKMFIVSKDNTQLSFTLFGIINSKAFYLNGGRLLDSNKDFSLTLNMLKSFKYFINNNVDYLDLVGVNSPKRGFWKLGFGGNLKPYYSISFNKNR
jgi:hypothetical protein